MQNHIKLCPYYLTYTCKTLPSTNTHDLSVYSSLAAPEFPTASSLASASHYHFGHHHDLLPVDHVGC
jgi:hypothetical protein